MEHVYLCIIFSSILFFLLACLTVIVDIIKIDNSAVFGCHNYRLVFQDEHFNSATIAIHNDTIPSYDHTQLQLHQSQSQAVSADSALSSDIATGAAVNSVTTIASDTTIAMTNNGSGSTSYVQQLFPWLPALPIVLETFNLDQDKDLQALVNPLSLRRYRPIIGDVLSFRQIINQIKTSQTCLKVAVFGGSISFYPSDILNKAFSWWKYFELLINEMYPCNPSISLKSHSFTEYDRGGVCQMLSLLESTPLHEYDIILIDSVNNDAFGSCITERDASKMEYQISYFQEKWIRILRSLPQRPLIMYIEMAWRWGPNNGFAKPPYWNNFAAFAQEKMLFYYQIATISVFRILYPSHLYNDIVTQTHNQWQSLKPHDTLFKDCCHPLHAVHKLAALLIMQSFMDEINLLGKNSYNVDFHVYATKDNNNNNNNLLPKPWMLNENDEKQVEKWSQIYYQRTQQDNLNNVMKIIDDNTLILSDETVDQKMFKKFISYNQGWKHINDHKIKKKFGFVAFEQGSVFTINLNTTEFKKIDNNKQVKLQLFYLKTYENIGKAVLWIDDIDKVGNMTIYSSLCKQQSLNSPSSGNQRNIFVLDGYWEKQASQYGLLTVDIPQGNIEHNQNHIYFAHVCTLFSSNTNSSKFKISRIQLFVDLIPTDQH